MIAMAESNASNFSPRKQDLPLKICEYEEEIKQLRKRLVDYSIKARHEKYVLEKSIASMRLAFDKQQQSLVDAESKALSLRRDIIEENVRLTCELQDAEQERSKFISSLVPLLAKYSLEPPVPDAHSIVNNVKVLFEHLHEKLILIENKDELELIPRRGIDRNVSDRHRSGLGKGVVTAKNVEADDELGIRLSTKNSTHGIPPKEETSRKEVVSRESGNSGEVICKPLGDGNHQNGRETSASGTSADDGPLPAIEGLQIFGEAFPGRELQARGFSINGTTVCNFKWIRHLKDGSVNFIDGAGQPKYLVTADDVDTYLAIEVLPLDDRNRKGEPVKVFANDKKKVTCDPEMQSYIEKTLYIGHAYYKVSLSEELKNIFGLILQTGYLDIWEPATLAIKREGYSIKCSGPRGDVVAEKFSSSIKVIIPYGHVSEFIIICSGGVELLLRAENSSTNVSGFRDTIVLILRLFILRAEEKRGKKKALFFNK
ncbi:uncharacterized protein G2W53_034344 [Senna tora]|uniref:Uncharacterized protein n=1 Tax=Senna tora TaxID=362788 RepID=A0A834SZ57_9FABA|nr:uncharacterized protein G2W53_034344 [Senna tora]